MLIPVSRQGKLNLIEELKARREELESDLEKVEFSETRKIINNGIFGIKNKIRKLEFQVFKMDEDLKELKR
jgi:hypothetical protein